MLHEVFTTSLLPKIAEDMVKVGAKTKEKTIIYSNQLDLIYSQVGTLYDIIPNGPRS